MDSDSRKDNDISRRKFLQNSAALVSGAFVSSLPSRAARGSTVSNNDTLKLALVGCGGRGTGAAVQALRTEGPVELVAMADAFQDKLKSSYKNLMKIEEVKESVNVPEANKFVGLDAYKKAIDKADVVILATPPGFRPYHFEEAIEADKHVFMEKPLASDAPGIRKILENGKLAEEKNLSVVVGLQNRFDVGYNKLVKKIQNGAIGDITSAKCNYLIGDLTVNPRQPQQTELEYQIRNWHYFNWLWAGAPAGLMIHYTDIVHWAKGSFPVKAQGVGGRAALKGPDSGEIYDHFYIEYEYGDGTKLHSEIRHIDGAWFDRKTSFQGTCGTASKKQGIRDLNGERLWKHEDRNDPNPYQVEHDKFFASIRKQNPINTTELGAKSTMTSIMGRMAVHSGKVIEWDEALSSDRSLVPANLRFGDQAPIQPDEDGNYPVPVPGKTKVL